MNENEIIIGKVYTFYLDQYLCNLMKKEKEKFNVKRDTDFIKRVLLNGYREYRVEHKKLSDLIRLQSPELSDEEIIEFKWQIINVFRKKTNKGKSKKGKKAFHIRINKNDDKLDLILWFGINSLVPVGVSLFIADNVQFFFQQSELERERIFFKKEIAEVEDSLKKGKILSVRFKDADSFETLKPEEIFSKEGSWWIDCENGNEYRICDFEFVKSEWR